MADTANDILTKKKNIVHFHRILLKQHCGSLKVTTITCSASQYGISILI